MEWTPAPFQVALCYPHHVRQFLAGSVKDRENVLVAKVESQSRYFAPGADGQPLLKTVHNSPDLQSAPSEDHPENDAFVGKVIDLFRDMVEKQNSIESSTEYGADALEAQLSTDSDTEDAWVIAAKMPNAGDVALSLGDELVQRLVKRPNVGHVWSTSRTRQESTRKHTHFSADLNTIQSQDFNTMMTQIDRDQGASQRALNVYYIFSNTGNNCETNPETGKTLNRANIDTSRAFLEAASSQGWLTEKRVRIIVVSSFHSSPSHTLYNDRLLVRPSATEFGSADSDAYKKTLADAKGSAGLLEYTSSKFASAALFVAAFAKVAGEEELRLLLEQQVRFVEQMHHKLSTCPDKSFFHFNDWVLDNLADEIRELERYVDAFYEDTAGAAAHVRHPCVVERMGTVKIPFSLTTMIATRAARVSLKTGVKSLFDSWIRTKGRLGWAISPAAGAAWLEAAAVRMRLHTGTDGSASDRSSSRKRKST